MNYEVVQPFFSELQPKHRIYRSQFDRDRYYFAVVDNEITKLPSVTTILDATMPTPFWLIRWIANWGYEQALEKRNQAAHYGTLFSIVAAHFLKYKEFDLDTMQYIVESYILNNQLNIKADFWTQKLQEDLYALNSFATDYNFEPLAIELPLISKKYRFAGTIDAIGWLHIGSGVNGRILKKDKELRKVLAIIDWKTGRHGFYASNEAQLHMYRLLAEENFPEILKDTQLCLYNWAPKDWENEEDQKYVLKEQSESREKHKILHYIQLFHLDHTPEIPKLRKFSGVLRFKQSNGNLQHIELSKILNLEVENGTFESTVETNRIL